MFHAVEQSQESATQEFLTFSLGGEEYAVDILKVQEIRGYDNVTRIANAPDFIKGVTDLRGVVVPIIDLRLKLGFSDVVYDGQTMVIVLNVADRVVGAVVDGVTDVMALPVDQIKPAPEFGGAVEARYVNGLASLEDRMLILVDIDALLTHGEIAVIDRAAVS
ncbi:MAG: chemotaxis protein CheW [Halomonas sp.]